MNAITNWFKRNASTILTCIGAGGMVATVYLTAKATATAVHRIDEARIDKIDVTGDNEIFPELTVMETVQLCWKDYIPPVVAGTSSLVCIFGANALSRKQQASLATAYTALANVFENYRGKVRDICGPKTDEMVVNAIIQEEKDKEDDNPPWDTIQLFGIDCDGKMIFFKATMNTVLNVEYDINRMFVLQGIVTLNELLGMFDLDAMEGGDLIGWEEYIGETEYGYRWIDFCHRHTMTEDGTPVCMIDMPFAPHSLCEEDYFGKLVYFNGEEVLHLQD